MDFADVKAIMQDSGIAMLDLEKVAEMEKLRLQQKQALNSPLLEKSIEGAQKVLLNITSRTRYRITRNKRSF